jgi:hypothetical protein
MEKNNSYFVYCQSKTTMNVKEDRHNMKIGEKYRSNNFSANQIGLC